MVDFYGKCKVNIPYMEHMGYTLKPPSSSPIFPRNHALYDRRSPSLVLRLKRHQRFFKEIKVDTLQGINISHLGKRKIIFKMPFFGDMLVSWRVRWINKPIIFQGIVGCTPIPTWAPYGTSLCKPYIVSMYGSYNPQ